MKRKQKSKNQKKVQNLKASYIGMMVRMSRFACLLVHFTDGCFQNIEIRSLIWIFFPTFCTNIVQIIKCLIVYGGPKWNSTQRWRPFYQLDYFCFKWRTKTLAINFMEFSFIIIILIDYLSVWCSYFPYKMVLGALQFHLLWCQMNKYHLFAFLQQGHFSYATVLD